VELSLAAVWASGRRELLGPSTPDQLPAMVQAKIELWGPMIKAANIKGE